jgi:DUF1680 family protein
MFQPQMKRDEGCSEADWLRLSLELWRETGKLAYLAEAERTLFNEFSFNQFHTGDFGHHTLTAAGMSEAHARAWWCCTLHGLRAMAEVLEGAFHAKDGVLQYDLPVDGRGETPGLVVEAHSAIERDGTVRLQVVSADAGPHTLAARAPEWASNLPEPVTKVWKAGDVLTLRYEMKTNVVRKPKQPNQAALFFGPWLLAVDPQSSPAYFDEPHQLNKVVLPSDGALAPSTAAPGPFAVPVANFMVRYLPGGYPLQPNTAMLRPIAEHTGETDGNPVEWWLTTR